MSHKLWSIEHTDTFGGEPNYCWVNRSEVEIPEKYSSAWIVRTLKKELGWTGLPCITSDWGTYIIIRPTDRCEIVLATLTD
jgi:hypothetical protein